MPRPIYRIIIGIILTGVFLFELVSNGYTLEIFLVLAILVTATIITALEMIQNRRTGGSSALSQQRSSWAVFSMCAAAFRAFALLKAIFFVFGFNKKNKFVEGLKTYPVFDRPHIGDAANLSIDQVWANIDHLNKVEEDRLRIVKGFLCEFGIIIDESSQEAFLATISAIDMLLYQNGPDIYRAFKKKFKKARNHGDKVTFKDDEIVYSFLMDVAILIFAISKSFVSNPLVWWPEKLSCAPELGDEYEDGTPMTEEDVEGFAYINSIVVRGIYGKAIDIDGTFEEFEIYPCLEEMALRSVDEYVVRGGENVDVVGFNPCELSWGAQHAIFSRLD